MTSCQKSEVINLFIHSDPIKNDTALGFFEEHRLNRTRTRTTTTTMSSDMDMGSGFSNMALIIGLCVNQIVAIFIGLHSASRL